MLIIIDSKDPRKLYLQSPKLLENTSFHACNDCDFEKDGISMGAVIFLIKLPNLENTNLLK